MYLCDFHREQAWERWLASSHNGVAKDDKSHCLALMRAIARSMTDDECAQRLEDLQVRNAFYIAFFLEWVNVDSEFEVVYPEYGNAYRKVSFIHLFYTTIIVPVILVSEITYSDT